MFKKALQAAADQDVVFRQAVNELPFLSLSRPCRVFSALRIVFGRW